MDRMDANPLQEMVRNGSHSRAMASIRDFKLHEWSGRVIRDCECRTVRLVCVPFIFFHMSFTLGIDYGTTSVRALIVRCADGAEFGVGVVNYPSGQQGVLLDPKDHHLARQNPADYLY